MSRTPNDNAGRTIEIELLALDLTTCGRCTGTDRNLTEAIEAVAGLLRETGTDVRVRKHVITSAEQAKQLRFVASPTIRVDGRDIALEFKESSCKDCGDLCGCDGGVDCRVWHWRGEEHLEAPKSMIVDALLRAYAAGPTKPDSGRYTLPENLRRYFESKSGQASTAQSSTTSGSDCCDRFTCCDSSEKLSCCGEAAQSTSAPHAKAPCGCR